jgi:uncharacterized protein YbjT (DUF2867 family)
MYRSEEDARKASTRGFDRDCGLLLQGKHEGRAHRCRFGLPRVFADPALVELESNVIDASREKGVKHLVLNSALGAGDYPKSFPAWHRMVEDKLKASGLAFTILRPNSFMQNILCLFRAQHPAARSFLCGHGGRANQLS